MTSGTIGAAEEPLGLRPALDEVIKRQDAVLEKLNAPFRDGAELAAWKADVVQAAVGRVSDGLRALLADADLAPLVNPYYFGTTPQAQEWRLVVRDLVGVEFARALEELSRISGELHRGRGISEGRLAAPGTAMGGPSFVR